MFVQNRENICLFLNIKVGWSDRFISNCISHSESTYGFFTNFMNLENSIVPLLQIANEELWHGGKMTMPESCEISYLSFFLL
jgi:hypothetical protein